MFSGDDRARPSIFDAPIPQLVFLAILGPLALIGAVIFTLWSGSIDVEIDVLFDPSDAALKAGLAAWANIFLIVGVAASVAAIGLNGVLQMLKRVFSALESRLSSEDAR